MRMCTRTIPQLMLRSAESPTVGCSGRGVLISILMKIRYLYHDWILTSDLFRVKDATVAISITYKTEVAP
jgi:hypothetical protein